MDAERQEHEIDETARALDREADELEQRNEELAEHIDEAKTAAANRPEADTVGAGEEETEDVAGDWGGEATGSSQGEDAEDAT
jgi:hypothetical protein